MDKYEDLKLENQLCFPLYAAAKEVIKRYRPYLEKIDLTYTQYIAMMALWEYGQMNVKELGGRLYLDSGTLTPLLKKLESKGLVTRKRSDEDERNMTVKLTEEGLNLRDRAVDIPKAIGGCFNLARDEAYALYKTLYKMLKEN